MKKIILSLLLIWHLDDFFSGAGLHKIEQKMIGRNVISVEIVPNYPNGNIGIIQSGYVVWCEKVVDK